VRGDAPDQGTQKGMKRGVRLQLKIPKKRWTQERRTDEIIPSQKRKKCWSDRTPEARDSKLSTHRHGPRRDPRSGIRSVALRAQTTRSSRAGSEPLLRDEPRNPIVKKADGKGRHKKGPLAFPYARTCKGAGSSGKGTPDKIQRSTKKLWEESYRGKRENLKGPDEGAFRAKNRARGPTSPVILKDLQAIRLR